MKRRKFLNNITKLSAAPLLLNGMSLRTFASPSFLPSNCQEISDRVMVIIFLKGGNDGLNTIIPIDQYSRYANLRPDIRIHADNYINLDSTLPIEDQVGLNPAMTSFKAMYDAGQASLIQSVGYPEFNRSHFKSTDLWLTGGDGTSANFNINSGWMGRYLSTAFPGAFNGPTPAYPDPMGIQLGDSKPSLGFYDHGNEYIGINLSNQNPGSLFGLLNGIGTAAHGSIPVSNYGDNIDYIMGVENTTNAYGGKISDVYNIGANSATVYPDSNLANQLRTVACLLNGGSKTKLFLVHKSGFDTHANQVQAGSTNLGSHADLLTDVFDSVKAFTEDLTNLGLEQNVLTATFSEFGRRITQNGSLGTDHGNFAPVFLFGSGVAPGVRGTNINIDPTILDIAGNLPASALQHDYRSIWKTLLQDWLGAGDDILNGARFGDFNKIVGLVTPGLIVPPECYNVASALPVEFSEFTAEYLVNEKQVALLWKTEIETNHSHFIVQRSTDSQTFEDIELVDSVGESNTTQKYETIDDQPLPGISYYRIKSIDRDDNFEYTEVRSVCNEDAANEHIKLYPNPAKYDVNLVLTTEEIYDGVIRIFDFRGKKVKERSVHVETGFNKFNLTIEDLPNGNYTVTLVKGRRNIATMKLIVI